MRNYWSCTKFADWIRGTPKPTAETSRGWREWNRDAKSKHPIRYWIAEEALDAIQKFIWHIPDKVHSIKYYINNRWVTRTHALTAHPRDIKPGEWCDVGNRFLPCLFNELVDFVEVELAWKNIAWDEEARKKYDSPFWATGWFRWRTWRCPQAGLDYLDWASGLRLDESWGVEQSDAGYNEPTYQSIGAKEIKELYLWYKNIYLNRPDVHDVTGWSDHCAKNREKNGELLFDSEDQTEQEESRRILDSMNKLEEYRYDEETEMLTRLIKVRDRLWT